jgi:tetratricopeptide (TPR) repeat protein
MNGSIDESGIQTRLKRYCSRRWFTTILFYTLWNLNCTPAIFPVVKPVEKIEQDQILRMKAEEYFVLARDMERRGLDVEAERLYERAYDLDPSSPELRDHLVRKYMGAGKFMQALLLVKGKEKKHALTADEQRMIAGIYLKMGEINKAFETIEGITDKDETDYYSLAIMYEQVGNVDKALRYYRAFYQRNDESFGLGLKIVRMLLAQKQSDAADSLLDVLQNHYGDKAELYNLRGVLAMVRSDTTAALDLFNKAMTVDSLYEDAARNAAQVNIQKNDYGRAINCFETLYRNWGIYKGEYGRTLATLYYFDKRFVDASHLMATLLESSYNDADLHYYFGLVLIALGNNEQARIEIEKSIVLRDDYPEAWNELFSLAIREQNYDRAFETAERYRARLPQNAAAWRLSGYSLSLKKDYEHALPYLLKAVLLDSMDIGSWFELGSCYERNKDILHAADAFKRVLQLNPGDPAASNYLGYMWAEKGIRLDSAKVLLESALSKDPDNGAFLDSYAWIFFQQGSVERAYEYIVKAIVRIHNDPVVFEHLGDILSRRNDFKNAIIAYEKSLEYNPDNSELVRKKIIDLETVGSR